MRPIAEVLEDQESSTQSPDAGALERYRVGLRRYLGALGCRATDSDDLIQESFVILLEREDFTHSSDTETMAFLRRTARFRYLKHCQRQGQQISLAEVEATDRAWEELAGDGRGDELLECLGQLAPRARRALRLRYAEDAGRGEIAAALSINPGGVKSLLKRARAALKDCLERKLGKK